jgi:hypothetical protein
MMQGTRIQKLLYLEKAFEPGFPGRRSAAFELWHKNETESKDSGEEK